MDAVARWEQWTLIREKEKGRRNSDGKSTQFACSAGRPRYSIFLFPFSFIASVGGGGAAEASKGGRDASPVLLVDQERRGGPARVRSAADSAGGDRRWRLPAAARRHQEADGPGCDRHQRHRA